jgi:prolyl-tRNA synthetase
LKSLLANPESLLLRLSRSFLPVLKESPSDAQIVSHKLMLRAGLVRQTAAGIYAWLPIGLQGLEEDRANRPRGAGQGGRDRNADADASVGRPVAQSGRYDAYWPEMLRIKDRHDREMLYGPTNEEMITDIFKEGARSYRDLPRTLYHIQWKFRDEVRPRFGVMRGREFLMKDAYSFDMTRQAPARAITSSCWPICGPSSGWDPSRADEGRIGPDRRRPQP